MKNKLYICEHNVVISPKNQCIDCNDKDLRETLIKGGLIVDDNKQKINQQSLNQKPKNVSDALIEALIPKNKELVSENRQLKNKVSDLNGFITKCVEDISDLTKTISNSEKENKQLCEDNRQLKNEVDDLSGFISKRVEGNNSHKNDIMWIIYTIVKENKELEDKYNKLFQHCLTNACYFTSLKY